MKRPRSRPAAMLAIAGVLVVAAYACLGALQILVLNPLAAVPGLTLVEIHAQLAAAGEVLSPAPAITFVVLGLMLAGTVGAYAFMASNASPTGVTMFFLAILALGTPAYFAASFSAGMALADGFAISGGDYSRWSTLLYATSAVSLAGALVLLVRLVIRTRRSTPVVPEP